MVKRIRKIGCCALVAFTLVFNVSFDAYRGTLQVKGAELALAAMCEALVETLMLSLGMSYSSTTDLTAGGAALKDIIEWAQTEVAKEYDYSEEIEIWEQYEAGLSYGDSITLSKSSYDKLRSTIFNMSASHISPFCDSVNPFMGSIYKNTVSSIEASNISLVLDDDYPFECGINEDLYGNYSCLITVDAIADVTPVFVMYGCEKDADYSLILNDNNYGFVSNESGEYVRMMYDQCYFDEENLVWSNCHYSTGLGTFVVNTYNQAPLGRSSMADYRVLITTGFKVYSSYEEFYALNDFEASLTYSLYGSQAVAKEHTETEEGVVSIPLVEPYVTAQVQDAIEGAITQNPALTEEEINALVTAKIKTITEEDTKDDVTTGEIAGEVTGEEDINLLYDLTGIFPFCIPFDLYEAIKALESAKKTPVFEIPINFDFVGVEYVFVFDLTEYDGIIDIIKAFEILTFCVGLMFATGKLMKW